MPAYLIAVLLFLAGSAIADQQPRARDFGIPIFLAFSTANVIEPNGGEVIKLEVLSDDAEYTLDYIYEAVVDATEEAIINAIIAAETMTGANGVRIDRLDHATLRGVLRQHNRLRERD